LSANDRLLRATSDVAANLLAVRVVRPPGAEEFLVGGLPGDLAGLCPCSGGGDKPDNPADDQHGSEDGADERPTEGEAQSDDHCGSDPDDDDRGHPLNVPPLLSLQTGDGAVTRDQDAEGASPRGRLLTEARN